MEYVFGKKEANFGPPLEKEVEGGTHITFEILLKRGDKFVALRRPKAIPGHEIPEKAKNSPKGLLYFCHGLIRYGESVEDCISGIVKDQAGVEIEDYKVFDLDSEVQEKDGQWAITAYCLAELAELPKISELVTEAVEFDKSSIPDEFGWWPKEELESLFADNQL